MAKNFLQDRSLDQLNLVIETLETDTPHQQATDVLGATIEMLEEEQQLQQRFPNLPPQTALEAQTDSSVPNNVRNFGTRVLDTLVSGLRGFGLGTGRVVQGVAVQRAQIEDNARGLIGGLAELIADFTTDAENLSFQERRRILGEGSEDFDITVKDRAEFRAGQAISEFTLRHAPVDPQQTVSHIDRLAEAVGGTAPFLLAGLIHPAVAVATGAQAESADLFERALSAGVDEDKALEASIIGNLSGAVEAVPVVFTLRSLNKASGNTLTRGIAERLKNRLTFQGSQRLATAGRAGGGALLEAGEEFVQSEIGNRALRKIAEDKPELLEDVVEAGRIGGEVGLLLNLLALGIRRARSGRAPRRTEVGALPDIEVEKAQRLLDIEEETGRIPSRRQFQEMGLPAMSRQERRDIMEFLKQQDFTGQLVAQMGQPPLAQQIEAAENQPGPDALVALARQQGVEVPTDEEVNADLRRQFEGLDSDVLSVKALQHNVSVTPDRDISDIRGRASGRIAQLRRLGTSEKEIRETILREFGEFGRDVLEKTKSAGRRQKMEGLIDQLREVRRAEIIRDRLKLRTEPVEAVTTEPQELREVNINLLTFDQLRDRAETLGVPTRHEDGTPKKRNELFRDLQTHARLGQEYESPVPYTRSPADNVGFVPLSAVAETAKRIGPARAWALRMLRSRGDLPQQAFVEKIARDGFVERETREMVFTLRDFDAAIKRVYGGRSRMTPEQVELVDQGLRGNRTDELPQEVREIVNRMRNHIDSLSHRFIGLGAVEGEMAAIFNENLGTYVHRSYRIFSDPKWAENVSPEVRNRAKSLIRSEFPDLTDSQVEGMIEELLFRGAPAREILGKTPIQVLSETRLGSKNLSILKQRKGIPEEIRALWGEFRDARVNYAESVTRMAHLLANHRFLTRVREQGIANGWLLPPDSPPEVNERGEFIAEIAPEGSLVMRPLAGLKTTPEIARAFRDAVSPESLPNWFRFYMKVNAATKYAKTVGSIQTHIRNTLGNMSFAVANGHWRAWEAQKAIRTTIASLSRRQAEFRPFFLRLAELGVVADNARAGELQAVLRDAFEQGVETFTDNSIKRKLRRVGRVATEAYRAEDDVWKIFAFLNEKARYRKAKPNWTEEQVEEKAAEIVRNTYPTYSLAPEIVRRIRRFPLTGPFITFPAEVVRTSVNTSRLTLQELRDPDTRAIGAQRLVGMTLAATGTAMMTAAMRHISGVGWDEDEDLRKFMAPWDQNAQLLHFGKDAEGQYQVLNLSYVDAHEYLKTPVIALWRGVQNEDELTDIAVNAALEAFNPVIGEELLAERILDAARNKKKSGSPVYNPQDEGSRIAGDIAVHVGEVLVPGTISSHQRIAKGLRNEVSPSGRPFDAFTEALATYTGQRLVPVNVPNSLGFRVTAFNRAIGESDNIVQRVVFSEGTRSPADIRDAHERSENARRRNFEDMSKVAAAAKRLGQSEKAVLKVLEDRGMSREERFQVLSGTFHENKPLSSLLWRATSPSADDDVREDTRTYLRAIDMSISDARRLLTREARWHSRKTDIRGMPIFRSSPAFVERVFRLRNLVR